MDFLNSIYVYYTKVSQEKSGMAKYVGQFN